MEKAKHTPAPWDAQWGTREGTRREKGWHVFIPDTIKRLICEIPDPFSDSLDDYAEVKANAILIAAAPELLAVCERLLEDAAKYRRVQYEAGTYAELNAVVAKAKGG